MLSAADPRAHLPRLVNLILCLAMTGHRIVSFLRVLLLALGAAISAQATTIVPPEFATLVNESDYIVQAVVKNVTVDRRADAHGGKIFTRVELEVVEVIAGTPPTPLTLELLGGRLGNEQLRVEGMPEFHVGDEDILFVSGNGRTICPLYAMTHGRYPVQKDTATGRKFIARADGAPLHATAQVALPLGATAAAAPAPISGAAPAVLAPTDFIREIRATVKPDARLNRAK